MGNIETSNSSSESATLKGGVLKPYAPIDPSHDHDLFEKCSDGVIFVRLLKKIRRSLVHDKCINTFERTAAKRKVNIPQWAQILKKVTFQV